MKRSFRREHGGISSFEAYATSLAARVGTGNLAGVAIALELGGPGAVFWMWVTALVGMATSFFESTLAQVFKIDNGDGTYRGGPAYYMQMGLGRRWMGVLFSVFLVIAYGLAFNGVQANSMAAAVRVAEIVVPVMAIAYLALALWLVASHADRLPGIFRMVIDGAFGLEQAGSGALGYAVAQAVMNGVRRGLFSNEAGSGSAPNAAATADVRHPASQGYVQMLGVFTDTIVICTCTAAIILVSGVFEPGSGVTGMALTQAAMGALVGDWGPGFMAVALLFFAFTSIMANYYYGETSIRFVNPADWPVRVYRLFVLGVIVLGSGVDLPLVWSVADLAMGLMTLVNVAALLLLSGVVVAVMKDYHAQMTTGVEPVFDPTRFPALARKLAPGVWTEPRARG